MVDMEAKIQREGDWPGDEVEEKVGLGSKFGGFGQEAHTFLFDIEGLAGPGPQWQVRQDVRWSLQGG